jgi:DNA-binding MarR family transcriptional regulator
MKLGAITEKLEYLGLGELDPKETLNVVFAAAQTKTEDLHHRTLEALRSNTWKLLTSRVYGADAREWHDVFRKSASLFAKIDEHISLQIRVLADMALESARFGAIHSLQEIASKEHVSEILEVLAQEGGCARRGKIIEATRLKQANLSRIIANMCAVGLLDRTLKGREVELYLTTLAREYLKPKASPEYHDTKRAPSRLITQPPIRPPTRQLELAD